ncbi:MAG: ABC transporter ATP-binding protein [Dehalococcoidia bacterium]
MSSAVSVVTAASLSLSGVAHDYVVRGVPVPALTPIDLDLQPGEFVSLIGPSGCGKSTLLRIAGGLLAPSRGHVRIDGRPPKEAQRAKEIGFVFQDASLLPWRTVAANVRLALEVNRQSRLAGAEVDPLLALVGLAGYRDYYPHQLSGGMKQRVALARALVPRPSLLLMDEPFGALDDMTRTDLRHELLRIRERLGATVLFVTHSIAEAVLLSDRVAVMSDSPGSIVLNLPIELPRPRTPDLEESPPFLEYARRLRSALRGAY